jgi:hypothetical protein
MRGSHLMDRLKATRLVQRRLEAGYPRLQMFLLVLLTGSAGFLASYLMLHMGFGSMGPRYLAAMVFAYLAFLVLLGLWLHLQGRELADHSDGVELGLEMLDATASSSSLGGTFDSIGGIGDLGAIGDADEGAVLVIGLFIVLLLVAVLLSSVFVIYSAPALFAEIVVDTMLSASLYRRLQGLEPDHWLQTAVRRTILPFVLTTIVVTMSGIAMSKLAPGAHTMGEALFSSSH